MTTQRGVLSGTVTAVHDIGRIVVVELDLATGIRGLLAISYYSGRRGARRWQPGQRVTAWGWGTRLDPTTPPPAVIALNAFSVAKWRPGHRPKPLDPTLARSPHERTLHQRERIRQLIERLQAEAAQPPPDA